MDKELNPSLSINRIRPETPFKREKIATIPTKYHSYQHSFAMTENYAIIFESPWYFDVMAPLMAKDASEAIKNDPKGLSKIHVVHILTGGVKTFELDIWSTVLHFGNAFEDGTSIVFDAPCYEDPNRNPFDLLLFSALKEPKITEQASSSRYKRFRLDLDSGIWSMEDMIVMENGQVDLPVHNPKFDKKDYRYSYVLKLFEPSSLDSKYHWPIVKYDVKNKKEVSAWTARFGREMFAA